MSSAAGQDEEVARVLAVHEAFYASVEAGDLDGLRAVWSREEGTVCVHPGAAAIHGTSAVLRSWALVMAAHDYIQFFLTDVRVTVAEDSAVVTCTENVLRDDQTSDAVFAGGRAQALTVLAREAGDWRLRVHQSSPVGSDVL